MPGRKYINPNMHVKAREWNFQGSPLSKIIYNPAFGSTPACFSVFTIDRNDHAAVQNRLDPIFPETMGRDGRAEHGTGHMDLHVWIQEDYRLANEHPHDHFKFDAWDHPIPRDTILQAVTALGAINYITDPINPIVQYLTKGL